MPSGHPRTLRRFQPGLPQGPRPACVPGHASVLADRSSGHHASRGVRAGDRRRSRPHRCTCGRHGCPHAAGRVGGKTDVMRSGTDPQRHRLLSLLRLKRQPAQPLIEVHGSLQVGHRQRHMVERSEPERRGTALREKAGRRRDHRQRGHERSAITTCHDGSLPHHDRLVARAPRRRPGANATDEARPIIWPDSEASTHPRSLRPAAPTRDWSTSGPVVAPGDACEVGSTC